MLVKHQVSTEKLSDPRLQTIHTLDIYAESSTIHGLFSGIDEKSQQTELRYLRSQDAGNTWSAPVTVNAEIATIKKSKRGNDFQLASYRNKVMAVWRTIGAEPWVGTIVIALSLDQGFTWHKIPSPVDEKYANIDQGYFDLSADSKGNFHIVWLDDREEAGDTQGLRYAQYNDGNNGVAGWEKHAVLEQSACTCCWSRITADEKNNIYVLYRNDEPRDMMLRSSLDNGFSWQASRPVWSFGWEFVGCPHQGGGVATTQTDDKTVLHSVVWNGDEKKRGLYYHRSGSALKSITSAVAIGSDTSASGDIAVLDSQSIGIVYTTGDAENRKVVAKLSSDSGVSWSAELQLTEDGAEPMHPRIVGTPEGFRVFWTEWQDNGDAIVMMSVIK